MAQSLPAVTRWSRSADELKHAAVECWTNDPCGANVVGAPIGSNDYLDSLLLARAEYMPWASDALDYAGARGLRVLDVGCGQGIDLINFAAAGAQVFGIDITPRHAEIARAHLNARGVNDSAVVVGDAEQLPLKSGTFDRVVSNGVLHHTPNVDMALREFKRVLRPGGTATVIVYNRRSFHYWLTQVGWWGIIRRRLFRKGSMDAVLSETVEYSRIGARPLVHAYTASELRSLLERSGFVIASVEARHFHWNDTPVTYPLELASRRFAWLGGRRLRDRIGRVGGWYLVARTLQSS